MILERGDQGDAPSTDSGLNVRVPLRPLAAPKVQIGCSPAAWRMRSGLLKVLLTTSTTDAWPGPGDEGDLKRYGAVLRQAGAGVSSR